ncbi:hypothetical protein PENTCL1PPCAC_15165, partial [Pristionchus entomophagus]
LILIVLHSALYAHVFFFAPFVLSYLAWFFYSRRWPERGCMPSNFVRSNSFHWQWAGDYFNHRIVKTAELPADRNYIVGAHPHGLLCIGMTGSFASDMFGIREQYKGLKTWSVTLGGHFLLPLRRESLMWAGMGATSKQNLQLILRQKEKGQAVTIAIGGCNEGIMSAPGTHRLKLADRKGFVKVAMAEGADLVPMFHFGENDTYRPVHGICPKRLRNAQAHIVKNFGFCPPSLVGESMIGLPWGGLVPIRTHLETVIGEAIHVEKNTNPSQEEVDKMHTAYCEKLIELFETHKANYGVPPEQRIILY